MGTKRYGTEGLSLSNNRWLAFVQRVRAADLIEKHRIIELLKIEEKKWKSLT
jgi:hypothetical protein